MAAVCGQTYVWPGGYDRFLTSHIAATSSLREKRQMVAQMQRNMTLDKLTPDPPFDAKSPHRATSFFMVRPDIKTEDLLVHACESLASANTLINDFATYLNGPQRNTALAIAQVVMLAELAVNRALDNIDPQC
jgi:hypothetical protein